MTDERTSDFALSDGEKSHPLWQRLSKHFEKKLQGARIRNDDPKLTETQTADLRGEIRTLKAIINLGKDRPPVGQ